MRREFLCRLSFNFLLTFALLLLFWLLSGWMISSEAQVNTAGKTGQPFVDVTENYWAFDLIIQLANQNLITGYPDGTFRPDKVLTRGEFAALLARAIDQEIKSLEKSSYKDVELSEWYAPVIAATGKYIGDFPQPNGSCLFKPFEPILREQAIAAFLKAEGSSEKTPINPDVLYAKFKDYDKVATELKDMLAWAVEQGLVTGYADGTLRPRGMLTRAEAAALLERIFSKTGLSVKNILESGLLKPLTKTDPQYKQLTETLQRTYPYIEVKKSPVKLYYYASDFLVGEGKKKILYVFVSVDTFKYFTFSDVDYKSNPNAVLEYNEKIAIEAGKIFFDRPVIVLIGYTNVLYYDPTGVFEDRYITYNEKEQNWQINRFYTGVKVQGEKILEKWKEDL